jgi:hypothetical protein
MARDANSPIGVLQALDNHMPIDMAMGGRRHQRRWREGLATGRPGRGGARNVSGRGSGGQTGGMMGDVPRKTDLSAVSDALLRAPSKRVPRNEAARLSRRNDPPVSETKHPGRSRGAWRS